MLKLAIVREHDETKELTILKVMDWKEGLVDSIIAELGEPKWYQFGKKRLIKNTPKVVQKVEKNLKDLSARIT